MRIYNTDKADKVEKQLKETNYILNSSDNFVKLLNVAKANELPLLKSKFAPECPKLISQPISLADIDVSTGTTLDEANLYAGNPTIKITPDGTSKYVRFNMGAGTDLSGYEYLDLHLRITDVSALTICQLEFSKYTNFVDYFRLHAVNTLQENDDDGWRYLRIPLSTMAYGGTNTPASAWNDLQYFKISINGVVEVNIGKIELVKKHNKANIFLYFDDGYESQYSIGYKIAQKYGLRGTIGVVTSTVGTGDMASLKQLKEMHDNGWIVCSHTDTHKNLTTITDAEIRTELSRATYWLQKNGFGVGAKCHVAVGGGWNSNIDKIAKSYFTICRTKSYGVGVYQDEHQYHPRVQKYISPLYANTVAEIKSWIDGAIASKKELCLAWHRLANTNPTSEEYIYLTSNYEEIIKYIKSKVDDGLCNVVNWHDTMF
jgi:peptidoglycan/xylan/chitin deacetylase (PgdA/CDA1 family)